MRSLSLPLVLHRRTLLAVIGGASATVGLPALVHAAAPARKRIKQGLWKINFGRDSKLSFDQMCQEAVKLGVAGFDLIPPQDWPILRNHGLEPLLVGPGLSAPDYLTGLVHPEAHENVVKVVGAQIDTCAKAAAKRIGITAGQRRSLTYAQAADNAVVVLKRLAPKLEAAEVTLCIENVNDKRKDPDLSREDMVFGHWDWGVEVATRVASPNVKLLCDLYHLQVMDGDLTATIRRDQKLIGHFHVAGVPARTEIDGRQEVDYRAIARVIAGLDYDGYVCHEWRPSPGADPLKSLAEAVALLDV
jgi:hydroxypyruvate isomerase